MGGGGDLSENYLSPRKICGENCFSDNVEELCSKHLWKIISANVKADVKQAAIKELVAVSYKLLQEV